MDDRRENYRSWGMLRLAGFLIEVMGGQNPRSGVTWEQAGYLLVVDLLGERATPATVARAISRRPHTISQALSDLEKKGLLRKHHDLPRANRVRIELTPRGKEVVRDTAARSPLARPGPTSPDASARRLEAALVGLAEAASSVVPVSREFTEVFRAVSGEGH